MARLTLLAALSVFMLALTQSAEARKDPGNPLGPPTLVSAEITGEGDGGECDGDDQTIDDVCLRVTFTKVCGATKFSVDVTKTFDTDDQVCGDETSISENTGVPLDGACDAPLNCLGDTAACQTSDVPLGTTEICIDTDQDGADCINDLDDVLVEATSLCVKVKGLNPAQKGPNSISQSTEFSNTICPDEPTVCD